MTIIQAIILGTVQGLTEFLPVSSSGHLVLVQSIFNISGDQLFFDTMLHIASLIAVFAALWKDIKRLLINPFNKTIYALIIASIPAIIAALLFEDFVESAFSGTFLAVSFMFTGVVLLLAEWLSAKSLQNKQDVGYMDALIIGLCQAVALLPGVSRSGMTLSGGIARGIDRVTAAKFSFLMSIIIILGSGGYEALKLIGQPVTIEWLPLIFGMVFAAVSGYLAIKLLLDLVAKRKLYGFAVYVLLLSLFVFIDQCWTHIVF